ncbi:MAG: DUF2341 domain-containing protein, partial [Candidatus Paceibacterota bacterium]
NGDNTFEFFDDFNGGSLDTNKWTLNSGSVNLSSGILTFSATGNDQYLYSKNNNECVADTSIVMRLRFSGTYGDRWGQNWWSCSSFLYRSSLIAAYATSDKAGIGSYVGAYYNWEIWRNGSSQSQWFIDNTLKYTYGAGATSGVWFTCNTGGSIYCDWVFVRKRISTEPTPSFGAEVAN